MNYSGTDKKYRVTTEITDFSLLEDYFEITIKNRWGRVKKVFKKEDCFNDEDGNFYFTLYALTSGVYNAEFKAYLDDDDFIKREMVVVDRQVLCVVDTCDCCREIVEHCNCEHKVHYEEVWTTNMDDGIYLVDREGAYILTNDGKRIKFKSA